MYQPSRRPFHEIIAIEVLGGFANPQPWGKGGHRGSGMVPFERALLCSYRTSIVTFSLSLRVSEIVPLLCSNTPFFPTLPLVSPNFPMLPWEQVDGLWTTKSVGIGLIGRAISFQDFQCVPDPPTLQSYRQTDGQTDGRHAIAIPRYTL